LYRFLHPFVIAISHRTPTKIDYLTTNVEIIKIDIVITDGSEP